MNKKKEKKESSYFMFGFYNNWIIIKFLKKYIYTFSIYLSICEEIVLVVLLNGFL